MDWIANAALVLNRGTEVSERAIEGQRTGIIGYLTWMALRVLFLTGGLFLFSKPKYKRREGR